MSKMSNTEDVASLSDITNKLLERTLKESSIKIYERKTVILALKMFKERMLFFKQC